MITAVGVVVAITVVTIVTSGSVICRVLLHRLESATSGVPSDTNGTLLAPCPIRTARDTVVVGTMNVVVIEGCGFGKGRESGE